MAKLFLAALLFASAVHGQSAKPVELYIGYSVGGGYDVYARLIARHMGRHLPGSPVIVPKNMPGAGSLTLANWLYSAAPRDGTVFGTIGRGIAFDPLLGTLGAQFKANEFGWVGSALDGMREPQKVYVPVHGAGGTAIGGSHFGVSTGWWRSSSTAILRRARQRGQWWGTSTGAPTRTSSRRR